MYVCLCFFLYYPEFNDLNFTYQLRFQKFKNKGDLGFWLTTLFFLVSIKRSSAKEQAKNATLSSTLKQIFAGWNESLLRAIKEFD